MSTSYESLRAKYGAEVEQSAEKTVTGQAALEKIAADAMAAAEAAEKKEAPTLPLPEAAPFFPEPAAREEPPVLEVESIPETAAPAGVPVELTPPETGTAAPGGDPALLELLREQKNALAELSRRMESFELKLASMGGKVEQMQHTPAAQPNLTGLTTKLDALCQAQAGMSGLAAKVEALCQAQARQEKANVDILRDSKNFQATVREQMQRELDGYRKQHSASANASLLTEIASLYIASAQAIGYVSNEKERRNISEIVLDGILELLEEQDVVVHTTSPGEKRNLKTCKTRKTVPTGDEALHGLVAASYAPSFTLGNQVLLKESIDTYVYDPALAPAPACEPAPAQEEMVPEIPAEPEPAAETNPDPEN